MTCNRDLLELFQVTVPENWTPTPGVADHRARQVCRRNRVTCCTFDQLKSAREVLDAGKSRLQRMLEPVHEMLAMFVGKVSDTFFARVTLDQLRKKGCVEAMGLYGAGGVGAEYFYSKRARAALRSELQGLFVEFPVYLKRVLRFFRNFVCSVCHPREKDFIQLTADTLRVTASLDSCAGIIDIHDYELRLAHAYKQLVEPMVRAARCVKSGKLESESKPLLTELVRAEYKTFTCLSDLGVANQDCRDLCQRDVFAFKMQFHLLARARDALTQLFPLLAHGSVADFYERTKSRGLNAATHKTDFYPHNGHPLRSKRRPIAWVPAADGLSLFTDHYSMARFEGVKREDDI